MAEETLVYKSCDVEREAGRVRIALPELMPLREARSWLERKELEEEQTVAFSEWYDLDPWDGAVICFRTMREIFGFVSQVEIPPKGFFSEAEPPAMLTVKTGPSTEIKIPWGRFALPGVSGYVQTVANQKVEHGPFFFRFLGQVKKKSLGIVQKVIDRMHERIRSGESIYRGKAITNEKDFLDIQQVGPGDLILPESIYQQVSANLFTPICFTKACEDFGVPLKRGVLLTGPFGVGKSLTAQVTAGLCAQNGWTFVLVKKVGQFLDALNFAKRYQPAVVFTEDIDQLVGGERTSALNEVLEQVDGVIAKGCKVVVVLTTNHVEKINPAMLRPGRLDAIVEFTRPDAEAARRLLLKYAGSQLDPSVDLEEIGAACAGMIPATIAEVGSRAKLSAIARLRGEIKGDSLMLTTEDILTAAKQLRLHQDLVETKNEDPLKTMQDAADKLSPVFGRLAACSNCREEND